MKELFSTTNLSLEQGILSDLFSMDEIIESAFKEFRKRGFPFPDMTIAEMKIKLNQLRKLPIYKSKNSTIGYKIADVFNKHRFKCNAVGPSSPVNSFFDDTKLKKALKMTLISESNLNYSYKGFMSLVNGTQACFNFRPGFAKFIYGTYCIKNGKVFDPSMGYGGD